MTAHFVDLEGRERWVAAYTDDDPFPDVNSVKFVDFRVVYSSGYDRFRYQYKPFPDAEWFTYHESNAESHAALLDLLKFKSKLTSDMASAINLGLRKKVFYKIERIN